MHCLEKRTDWHGFLVSHWESVGICTKALRVIIFEPRILSSQRQPVERVETMNFTWDYKWKYLQQQY